MEYQEEEEEEEEFIEWFHLVVVVLIHLFMMLPTLQLQSTVTSALPVL
jgi:hypothetical protein